MDMMDAVRTKKITSPKAPTKKRKQRREVTKPWVVQLISSCNIFAEDRQTEFEAGVKNGLHGWFEAEKYFYQAMVSDSTVAGLSPAAKKAVAEYRQGTADFGEQVQTLPSERMVTKELVEAAALEREQLMRKLGLIWAREHKGR